MSHDAGYVPPSWTGPSEHEVGQFVSVGLEMRRSTGRIDVLDGGRFFTNGFALRTVSVFRSPLVGVSDDNIPSPVEVEVEYPDGRIAGHDGEHPLSVRRDTNGLPIRPVLFTGARVEAPHVMVTSSWVWPPSLEPGDLLVRIADAKPSAPVGVLRGASDLTRQARKLQLSWDA